MYAFRLVCKPHFMMTIRYGFVAVLIVLATHTTWAKTAAKDDSAREVLDASFYGLERDNNAVDDVTVNTGEAGQQTGNDEGQRQQPALEPLDLPRGRRPGRRGYHGHHGNHYDNGGYHGYHRGRGHHRGGAPPCGNGHNCGRHGHGMGYINGHHGGQGGPWWMRGNNMTTEQQLTYMCDRLQSWPGQHHSRRMTWMLNVHRVNNETRDAMLTVWNNRRNEMLRCCSAEANETRLECVSELQSRRFDRVCSGEEPVCPWSLMSDRNTDRNDDGQPTLKTRCCVLQGSERTKCFQDGMLEIRRNGRLGRRGRGHHWQDKK